MKPFAECAITVVGLGLIGGSLAGALRGHCAEVIGVDRDPQVVAEAIARGFIDRAGADLEQAVRAADIIVLATPVRTVIELVETVGPWLEPGSLLMDVGSTKAEILEAMSALPVHIQALGGHPMCGKEISGIAAADPGLFRQRTFILSPLDRTSEAALELGEQLVRAVGAVPLIIDAERQDYLVGTISHLPYLLACALVSTADATTSSDPLVWQIVAGGFRDTSRVAGSDVSMMVDILLTNREEVVNATRICETHLARLRSLVEAGDEQELRAALQYIRETRKEMYP